MDHCRNGSNTCTQEKTGIPRVKEALESNDWEQLDAPEAASDFGNYEEAQETPQGSRDLDPESLDFGFDRADFEGLKKAIWNLNDDPGADPAVSSSSASSDHPNKVSAGPSAPDADAEGEIDEDEVAKVESMMRKLQAVREAGEGMSQDQRRRMAARAVEEVMKEL